MAPRSGEPTASHVLLAVVLVFGTMLLLTWLLYPQLDVEDTDPGPEDTVTTDGERLDIDLEKSDSLANNTENGETDRDDSGPPPDRGPPDDAGPPDDVPPGRSDG